MTGEVGIDLPWWIVLAVSLRRRLIVLRGSARSRDRNERPSSKTRLLGFMVRKMVFSEDSCATKGAYTLNEPEWTVSGRLS